MTSVVVPGPTVPAVDKSSGNWTKDWYPILQRLIGLLNSTSSSADTSTAALDAVVSGSDGRVLFVSGGVIATSANFYWDNTNSRLGINTSSPSAALDVQGDATTGDVFQFIGSDRNWMLGQGGTHFPAGGIGFRDLFNGATRWVIDQSGNVGVGNTSPVNTLDVAGSFGRGAPVTKTGDFTLAASENWVICNKGSSTSVTLPAASSWTGREVTIKTIQAQTVVSASSNVVPLTSASAGTAILAATAGKWATLVSDGSNWVIMAGN